MHIRFAAARDIPEMVSIINAAFTLEAFFAGPRTSQKQLEEMLAKDRFLVTENDGGHIVAAVYVEKRGGRGYFGMLSVDPPLQGKGLGGAMIEAVENYFRIQGCACVELCVLSLRPELLPLYRKFGYKETATEEFHPDRPLKDGVACHKIVMSKQL